MHMYETRYCQLCGAEFKVDVSGFGKHTKYCLKHSILTERTKLFPKLWYILLQHYPDIVQDVLRIYREDNNA